MEGVSYFFVLSLLVLFKQQSVTAAGVYIKHRGRHHPNFALIGHNEITSHDLLLCRTNLTTCCANANNPNGGGQGNWYYPNGGVVPGHGTLGAGQIYGRTRSTQVVSLYRSRHGVTSANGIYRCAVPDQNHVLQNRFVGLYTSRAGQMVISQAPQFSLISADPLKFTLIATTTGGPPTTAQWLMPSTTDGNNSVVGEVLLLNGRTSTVVHILTMTERIAGEYTFMTGNSRTNRGLPISSSLTIEGPSPPHGLLAVQSGITGIQACWNRPVSSSASASHLTGYRIFYKQVGSLEEQSEDVGPDVTCHTITGLQSETTYTLSIVSLSVHLPSTAAGPVNVSLESFRLSTEVLSPTSMNVTFSQPNPNPTADRYDIIISRVHGDSQALCPTFNHADYFFDVNIPYVLTDLQEFSSYMITVTTNLFTISSVNSTSPAAPSSAPQGLATTNVLSTVITVGWSRVVCIERNGVIESYIVAYGPENGTKKESIIPSRGSNAAGTFTTRGLTPSTRYSFEVAAVNSAGTGPFTEPLIVETDVPIIVPVGDDHQNATLKRHKHVRVTLSFEVLMSQLEAITWSYTNKAGETVKIYTSSHYTTSSDGLSITIWNLSVLDSGVYTITGNTTQDEMVLSSITLTIYAEPVIYESVGSGNGTTKEEKQNVTFVCRTDGIPLPTISWFHNNVPLLPNALPRLTTAVHTIAVMRPGIELGVEGTLTITDLRLSDAGQYQCKSSGTGRPDFTSFQLNVHQGNLLDQAFSKLDNLLSMYAQINSIEQVERVTTALEELASDVIQLQNKSLTDSYMSVVDNLLKADLELMLESQSISNTSGRILNVVERVAVSTPLVENETVAVIAKNMFAVLVQDVKPEFQSQTFSAVLGTDFMFGQDQPIEQSQLILEDSELLDTTAAISLPDSIDLRMNISTTGNNFTRLTHSVFVTESLFLRRGQQNSSQHLGSVVITASLSSPNEGEIKVENLDANISLFFAKNPELRNATNPLCSFWDPYADSGYGNWSQKGCWLVNETADTVHCECNHLTNFAILLDVSPGEEGPPEVEKTLEAITFIGISISILCLILTLITYLGTKKLRSTEAGKLVISLSCAFLGVYLSFILSFFAPKVLELCVFAGALVHYFLLVTFLVMGAEAIHLYIYLVLVIGFHIHHYVLKSMLVAWIIPVAIVVASVAPNYNNYINPNFCRPYSFPFWGGLFAPFLIIYIFNWTIFLIITINLIRKKCKRNDELDEKPHATEIKKHLIIAITLSLLLGLGWGFGIPATQGIKIVALRTVFQVLFIIFTSFQGLFIFVMQCVRSNVARNEWHKWFCIKSAQNELSGTYSFSRKFNRSFQSGSISSYKRGSQSKRTKPTSPEQTDKKHFHNQSFKQRECPKTNESSFIYHIRKQHKELETSSSSVPAYELSTFRRKSEDSNLTASL